MGSQGGQVHKVHKLPRKLTVRSIHRWARNGNSKAPPFRQWYGSDYSVSIILSPEAKKGESDDGVKSGKRCRFGCGAEQCAICFAVWTWIPASLRTSLCPSRLGNIGQASSITLFTCVHTIIAHRWSAHIGSTSLTMASPYFLSLACGTGKPGVFALN